MGTGSLDKLTMPKWGLSMTHGTVVEWLVNEGQEISVGTEVVEIETEKILSAFESPVAGLLRRQVATVGQSVPVGDLLGIVADADVDSGEIDRFIEEYATSDHAEEAAVDAPAPQTVDAAGQTLQYFKRGEGGKPLVFIHGFGGDLNNWLFNHEVLAANRAVYAVDLPGHGGSSKDVKGGTIDALADSIGAFMEVVALPQAHLVGHSLGGAVALALALERPELALSVTLIASCGLGAEIDHTYVQGFVNASRRNQLKPFVQTLFANPGLVTRQMLEDILKNKRIDGVEQALKTIAQQLIADGKQATNYRDRLAELSVPLLVLWGAKDQIIPVAHTEALPEGIQVKVFEDCGHMLPMEAASEVNQLIDQFVG